VRRAIIISRQRGPHGSAGVYGVLASTLRTATVCSWYTTRHVFARSKTNLDLNQIERFYFKRMKKLRVKLGV